MSKSVDNLSPSPTKCTMEDKFISNQAKKSSFIKNKKQECSIPSSPPSPSIEKSSSEKQKRHRNVKKSRCHTCKKKLGLVSFPCKCEFIFCSKHRYSSQHSCTYDYKKHYEIEYLKKNPKIQNIKIRKL